MFLIQYSFLFYSKNTQTKLKSRMMNLELKDFSLYDFLNLSLIKIYEPFLLSISKKYELVYVSKVPGVWRVSSFQFGIFI